MSTQIRPLWLFHVAIIKMKIIIILIMTIMMVIIIIILRQFLLVLRETGARSGNLSIVTTMNYFTPAMSTTESSAYDHLSTRLNLDRWSRVDPRAPDRVKLIEHGGDTVREGCKRQREDEDERRTRGWVGRGSRSYVVGNQISHVAAVTNKE